VVVVHTGAVVVPPSGVEGGTGGVAVPLFPPVPDEADPEPVVPGATVTGPEPEQEPEVIGWHVKPSPQSASALHGRSHVYVHWEEVVVVQTGSVAGGVVVQAASVGSHLTGTAVPPVHTWLVLPWQTMAGPQSVSAWQGASIQVIVTVGGGGVGQVVPGAHAIAGVAVGTAWQENPFAQSVSLVQV